MWIFEAISCVYRKMSFFLLSLWLCIYRGVVVNKYGMNQPLTMALEEESKDLKSFHFEIFHVILNFE